MFWTDWGEYPKVEKAGMDGKNRKTIVDRDIFWPNGIALDLENERLFWVDAKLHYIVRVDFDGNSRQLLNKGAPLHPFALAYHSDLLFWSDWQTK
jgi:low density lipoprotein receptor-related protein 5/6